MPRDYEALLVEHLELIDRVIKYVARRHHLASMHFDDFASLVRFKLIDRDCAVLRKFEGRSGIATYLTTVVERVYLDFCNAQWGKWRPSVSARRHGPVAVRLEELLVRDGMSFDEAVATLHTNHAVGLTREELRALRQQLPLRQGRRTGDHRADQGSTVAAPPDPAFELAADRELAERIEAALRGGMAQLTGRDRLVLKLRYLDDLPLASIARLLGSDAKPLYRRIEQVFAILRLELCRAGIDSADIERVVGHPQLTLGRILAAVAPGLQRSVSV